MGLDEKDLGDMKLARAVAIVDLWNIDDRVSKLEDLADRLEARENRLISAIETLENLYRSERVKNWQAILEEMIKKEDDRKRGQHGNHRFK